MRSPDGINYLKGKNIVFVVNGVTFEMVYVQGGTFTMGCTPEQGGSYTIEQGKVYIQDGFTISHDCIDDEIPKHNVIMSDFYIGKFEVTQLLWYAVMGKNISYWKGDNLPVENVSWVDCQEFISGLNNLTGLKFSLPTEAQWEYAARGGNQSKHYKYSGSNNIHEVSHSEKIFRTYEVGSKHPNELGIYDMSGNVWEWCSDWYDKKYYSNSPSENPSGPSNGFKRVLRGGNCRIAHRNYNLLGSRNSDIGFRLILAASPNVGTEVIPK